MKIFFLHFMKAGGTSMHEALVSLFEKNEICPKRGSFQSPLADSDYHDFNFISGHFSLSEALKAKANGFELVLVFREPVTRLTSMLNFLNAHDASKHPEIIGGSHPQLLETIAIQRIGPIPFLKTDTSRNSIFFNNYYGQVLIDSDASYAGEIGAQNLNEYFCNGVPLKVQKALEVFDYVCTEENRDKVLNHIRMRKNLLPLPKFEVIKVTANEMKWHEWMREVELVGQQDVAQISPDLIFADDMLYKAIPILRSF